MILGKKAQGEEWLKKGILSLAILVLLIILFNRIFGDIRETGEDAKCITSVNLADMNQGKIICPTNDVLIDETDEKKIIDRIILEQYKCGKKFSFHDGTADKNPFKYWDTDSICVICSNITFSNSAKAHLKNINPSEIELRLIETDIPKSNPKKSYYEFFTGKKPAEKRKQELINLEKTEESFPESDYYVVYVLKQGSEENQFWESVTYGAAGGIAAALVTRLLLPAGKLKVFLVAASVAGGASLGVATNKAVTEKFDTSTMNSVAIAFVPQEVNALADLGCHSLGNSPFENPFDTDEEEVRKIVEGG